MSDQPDELRELVLRSHLYRARPLHAPHKIAVCGGNRHMGTTGVAVQLAMALSAQGKRLVLVDADLNHPAVAERCGVLSRDSICDVCAGALSVHEVLMRGPSGIQVLPGKSASDPAGEPSETGVRRLYDELNGLGRYTDLIVIDAGNDVCSLLPALDKEIDLLLMVTQADERSALATYAAIKTLAGRTAVPATRLIVTGVDEPSTAAVVHERLERACRQFLSIELPLAAVLTRDSVTTIRLTPSDTTADTTSDATFDRLAEELARGALVMPPQTLSKARIAG